MARYVLALMVAVVIGGCGFAERHARVTYGNFEFSQGRYERARELYEGIPVPESSDSSDVAAMRDFNLGTVDFAVGNVDDALDRWHSSDVSSDEEVLYRARFNTGILHFEQGRYGQAYEAFRSSLMVQPDREAAKANLERAFTRWQRAGGARQAGAASERREGEPDESATEVLEQLRNRELERRRLRDEYVPPDDVDDW